MTPFYAGVIFGFLFYAIALWIRCHPIWPRPAVMADAALTEARRARERWEGMWHAINRTQQVLGLGMIELGTACGYSLDAENPDYRSLLGAVKAELSRLAALTAERNAFDKIIGRYLDNHCENADAEGMSALCECKLCLDARKARAALAPSQEPGR